MISILRNSVVRHKWICVDDVMTMVNQVNEVVLHQIIDKRADLLQQCRFQVLTVNSI